MSSNFAFLQDKFPDLADLGHKGEQYLYQDPNACFFKLRALGERIVALMFQFDRIVDPTDLIQALQRNLRQENQKLDTTTLTEDVDYDVDQFNRQVITEGFNKVVLTEIARNLDPSSPQLSGKALVFAANDRHADMVVQLLKEIFTKQGIDSDAIVKITGTSFGGDRKKIQDIYTGAQKKLMNPKTWKRLLKPLTNWTGFPLKKKVWATCTKAFWKKMPTRKNPGPGSTLRPGCSLTLWCALSLPSQGKLAMKSICRN